MQAFDDRAAGLMAATLLAIAVTALAVTTMLLPDGPKSARIWPGSQPTARFKEMGPSC